MHDHNMPYGCFTTVFKSFTDTTGCFTDVIFTNIAARYSFMPYYTIAHEEIFTTDTFQIFYFSYGYAACRCIVICAV